MCPCVVPRSPKARLNLEGPITLKQSTVLLCTRLFYGDRVDLSPHDRRVLVDAIAFDDLDVATYLEI